MIDQNKWIQIRKKLYLQIKSEVRGRLGEDSRELAQYRAAYQKQFRRRIWSSNKKELLTAIQKARVVLLADFHALKQSQKAQLRILRELHLESVSLILGVEFVDAAYQGILDAYLEGRLSEAEFLKRVHWRQNWGFDWDHYKPLLDWAMKHNVYVRALNKSDSVRSQKSLKARDEFSGKIVGELVNEFPAHKIIVIYGDLHLAPSHLPAEIQKHSSDKIDFCFVYQNSEDLYFKMLKKKRDEDVLKLSANAYCLMSVTPWVKWQNYLLYLEKSSDHFFMEDEDEANIDYTDHVAQYIRFIAQELGLNVSVDELMVYTAEDEIFWERVTEAYSVHELRDIKRWVAEEKSFYLAKTKMAFLVRPTVNHAVSLAMRYILAGIWEQSRKNGYLDFVAQIVVEAWVYFGTKIVNPKRKTDTLADLQYSLGARKLGQRSHSILKLCLAQRMFEILCSQGLKKNPPRVPQVQAVVEEAAFKLGGILGEKMYIQYRSGGFRPAEMIHLFGDSLSLENYIKLISSLEDVPLGFSSKRDKL